VKHTDASSFYEPEVALRGDLWPWALTIRFSRKSKSKTTKNNNKYKQYKGKCA
jgi:hypothetical protein